MFAETIYAALKGRDALKAKWDEGTNPSLTTESVEKHFLEGLDKPGGMAINKGDAKKAVAGAQTKVTCHLLGPHGSPYDHGAHQLHGLRAE